MMGLLFGVTSDSVYLSPAPLYHAAPLRFMLGAMALGATVVVMEHFDAEQFLVLVERHRVTHTQVVPTMFIRMLKLPDEVRASYDVSSLQVVIHAAAPCPIPVKQQMIEWWGPVIHEYYAGTEGNGFVYCNSEMWLAHPGTVGTPIACVVHISTRTARSCRTARAARSTSRAAPSSSTTTTRRRRSRHATRASRGARSATSATSTTTATCTSPIARRT